MNEIYVQFPYALLFVPSPFEHFRIKSHVTFDAMALCEIFEVLLSTLKVSYFPISVVRLW